MNLNIDEELLQSVKKQLGYKWCDDTTNDILSNYVADGLGFLKIYNPSANFSDDRLAFSLLVEYVRYALSNARDDFKINYREELILFADYGRIEDVSEEKDSE